MLDRRLEERFSSELATLSLPPESQWVPARRRPGRDQGVGVAVVALAVAVTLLGGFALRDLRTAVVDSQTATAATPRPTTQVVFPPARPTTIEGQRVAPLPFIARQAEYNLIIPAWWRHSEAEATAPRAPGLLRVEVYTGRDASEEAAYLGRWPIPWDLTVELWERDGRSAEEWARGLYACADDCTLERLVMRGAPAAVATWTTPALRRAYLIERGDRLIVLSYLTGTDAERPRDMTPTTLDDIIRSVGLP